MTRIAAVCLLPALLVLAACGTTGAPTQSDLAAQITQACLATGLFKPLRPVVDVAVVATFPVAQLPIALVRAGVDRACADPVATARDAATVAAALQALRGAVAPR